MSVPVIRKRKHGVPAARTRVGDTYRIGDHVRVENRASGDDWVIISNRGRIFAADVLKSPGEQGGLNRATYGTRDPGATWVLQRRSNASRNPVWTDAGRNIAGEGENEQRHCVVTRTEENIYRFWFFVDAADEIACIERSSKHNFETLLRCNNRGCDRTHGDARENEVGYVCWISDYLYFSADGLRVREAAAALQVPSEIGGSPPVYTRDFRQSVSLPAAVAETLAPKAQPTTTVARLAAAICAAQISAADLRGLVSREVIEAVECVCSI